MKKIPDQKLAAFSTGLMGSRGLSKRELEELKKKEEEEAAAHVFKEFVETFQEVPSTTSKVWVKAGTYDAGARKEDTSERGKLYKPTSRLDEKRTVTEADIVRSLIKAESSGRPGQRNKLSKDKKKSNLELFKEELRQEGCPVGPGFTLSKVFTLTPLLANNKDKWGLALDGQLKHEDTNLASSTLIADPSQRENLGIIVQYKVKVKLCLGPLGGDLSAELPFILMHPKPEEEPARPAREPSPRAMDHDLIQLDPQPDENGQEQDDDIIFEDFARLRLKGADTDA